MRQEVRVRVRVKVRVRIRVRVRVRLRVRVRVRVRGHLCRVAEPPGELRTELPHGGRRRVVGTEEHVVGAKRAAEPG